MRGSCVGIIIVFNRNIIRYAIGEGPETMPRPIELKGKKGVIFGGGGIGLNVAERLSAFGVEISSR